MLHAERERELRGKNVHHEAVCTVLALFPQMICSKRLSSFWWSKRFAFMYWCKVEEVLLLLSSRSTSLTVLFLHVCVWRE